MTSPAGGLSSQTKVPLIIGIIVLVVAAVIGGLWFSRHHKPSKPTVPPPLAKVVKAPTVQPQEPPIDFSVAGVHKGEGAESPIIRELIADPSLIPHYKGDVNDEKAVRHAAEHEAHLLAIKAGLVEWKFGEEAMIKAPDTVAFVVRKDHD